MKWSYSLELLIITVLGCIYFALHAPPLAAADYAPPALDLRPITGFLTDNAVRPIGLEHERLAGTILPVRTGIQRYGHIPSWNSLLNSGVPLTNNAFSYLFNPFHSLPVLLFDPVTGSKIAMLVALLIAGYSMWAFGLAVGLGALARVTIGLLYLANGSIAAKFGVGHFQLACSLAWSPLVLAALWWTLHSTKRLAPAAFGISFALLFYAGNIYYVLHTALCCLVIVILHFVMRTEGRWRIRWDRLRRISLAVFFAFGLAALQFFPIWQTRDFVTHDAQTFNDDGTITNNYDFNQSIYNLTVPWQDWKFPQHTNLFDAVDYAYVGSVVVILMIMALAAQLPLLMFWQTLFAAQKRYLPILIAAVILAVIMMLWAGGQVQPFPWLYSQIPLLAQFRYIGRALAIAALWWILLAGISIDVLWNSIRVVLKPTPHKRLVIPLSIAAGAWLFIFIYSTSTAPARIAMVSRSVAWWQTLDPFRYTSLPDALLGLIHFLIAAAVLDALILIGQTVAAAYRRKQRPAVSAAAAYVLQIGLVSIIALGVLEAMRANLEALSFSNKSITFDPIYDDIRRADLSAPFPSVGLPFSPYTFGAYENQIRVWSLNEGWLPAAPTGTAIKVNQFLALPRWLITQRNADGTFVDSGSPQFIATYGYQLRACYVAGETRLALSNCNIREAGSNLYEYPQALPYAFLASDYDLNKYPTTLHADQVVPVDILLYQQDTIVIHANDASTDFDKHYLVVQEANFPGWQATIDGVSVQPHTLTTYVAGNQTLGLIAIPVEHGNHTYALRFDPPGLTTGILVFIATLGLILVYLTYRRKQKSPA